MKRTRFPGCASSLWVVVLITVGSRAPAATLTVDERGGADFTAIQPAVDAAANGDIVLVAPGEYVITEAIQFNRLHDPRDPSSPPRKDIVLRSSQGAETTVIRMSPSPTNPRLASVVHFSKGEGNASVLEGFTLTGGQAIESNGGGGIYCFKSSPRVSGCKITGNSARSGGGVCCMGSFLVLEGCELSENSATERGGGLFCRDFDGQGHVMMERCTISRNSAQEGGGWHSETGSAGILRRCIITANSSTEQGGGMMMRDSSYPAVVNCLITGNLSRIGGGVFCRDQTYPYFRNCTISGNFAERGAGISFERGPYASLTNCLVWGNAGEAISIFESSPRVTLSFFDSPPPAGQGNRQKDPLFVSPGFWRDGGDAGSREDDTWVDGDYHLQPGSPAIDVGTTTPQPGSGDVPAPDDLDGKSRPCWKDVDAGAFEYCGSGIPGLPSIVFVARDPSDAGALSPVSPVRTSSYGRLMVRLSQASAEPIVDSRNEGAPAGTPVDVMDPDVSFDGKRIVFSGFSREDGAWRIYEVAADGTALRKVTANDRRSDLSRYGDAAPLFEAYDDLDPCYLPDGRICFVSTRYPESAPEGRLRATNLYTVRADGTDLRRITSERFGADTPAVDPMTGRIVYSRWWRTPEVRGGSGLVNPEIPPETPGQPPPPAPPPLVPPGSPGYGNQVEVPPPPDPDPPAVKPLPSSYRGVVHAGIAEASFPGLNGWSLASVATDGSGLVMFSGFHLDRTATQAYRPSFLANGEAIALFLTETPHLGVPGRFGLRRYARGPSFPSPLGGPQDFRPAGGAFRYASAAAMPDGRLLITGSRGEGREPASVDIFIQDNSLSEPEQIFFAADDLAELDATPLVARPVPPLMEVDPGAALAEHAPRDVDEAKREGGTFTFRVENLFGNAGVDVAIPNAPSLGRLLAIEFYMAPQRTSFVAADAPVLIQSVAIPPSGKVEVELPAGVPLFEVLRRAEGTLPVGRDGQIFHVGGLNYGKAGAKAVCVGCHAGHSMIEVPVDASFTNLASSAFVAASSTRTIDGTPMRPELLVDRRTDFFRSEWAAASEDASPTLTLTWDVPIEAREVVVYGARTGRGVFGSRTQAVGRLTMRTFAAGELVEERGFEQSVSGRGTRFPLSAAREIDELEITLGSFSGEYEGGSGSALSEIEVIARAVDGVAPALSYIRGDANCDSTVNLTDAMTILSALFRGESNACCRAAQDADGDEHLNITDPISLLLYLFRGGDHPPAPFPSCGRAPEGSLSCDAEICS